MKLRNIVPQESICAMRQAAAATEAKKEAARAIKAKLFDYDSQVQKLKLEVVLRDWLNKTVKFHVDDFLVGGAYLKAAWILTETRNRIENGTSPKETFGLLDMACEVISLMEPKQGPAFYRESLQGEILAAASKKHN